MDLLVVGISSDLETFLGNMLCGIQRRGISVTVVSSRRPGAANELTWVPRPYSGSFALDATRMANGALRGWRRWRRLRTSSQSGDVESGLSHQSAADFRRFIPYLSKDYDCIYFPWNFAAVDHLPLLQMGIPSVISCRGGQINVAPHDPRRREQRAGLPASFRYASAVHCVSHSIRDEATKYGLDPKKAVVINPAVDTSMFKPSPHPKRADGELRIVSTGSLTW